MTRPNKGRGKGEGGVIQYRPLLLVARGEVLVEGVDGDAAVGVLREPQEGRGPEDPVRQGPKLLLAALADLLAPQ